MLDRLMYKVNGFRITTAALSVVSLAFFAGAMIPSDLWAQFLILFSYGRDIMHLPTIIVASRIATATIAVVCAVIAIPRVRTRFLNLVFPLPPDKFAPVEIELSAASNCKTTIALFALTLPIAVSLIINPAWTRRMLREDTGYEWVTAVLYFAAFCVMCVVVMRAFRFQQPVGISHFIWIILGILLLFVGLEEVSYFQRQLGFDTPDQWKELNMQEEFNLHNVATGLLNRVMALAIVTCGVFLPVIASFSRRFSYLLVRLNLRLPTGAAVLVFAYGTICATPQRFNVAVLDEQRWLYWAVVVVFIVLLRREFRRNRAAFWPLLAFFTLLLLSKIFFAAFDYRFPVGNYIEEYKEFLFSLAFLLFTLTLSMRVGKRQTGENISTANKTRV